jgi:hypothetical protein
VGSPGQAGESQEEKVMNDLPSTNAEELEVEINLELGQSASDSFLAEFRLTP